MAVAVQQVSLNTSIHDSTLFDLSSDALYPVVFKPYLHVDSKKNCCPLRNTLLGLASHSSTSLSIHLTSRSVFLMLPTPSRFQVSVGFDGWLLKNLNAASLPQPFLGQLVVESLLAGLLRIVVQFYKADWHRTIRKWHQQKKK